ncbi:hypothetical protein [Tropicimonas marinistellae]|uniref:hypothetical protein n=1 Tax=Tropicimonas marinistellae TaxID=1739787 RepID=UPI00083285D2|nr:hypothetical protein [Tropicimonas marinistellae]
MQAPTAGRFPYAETLATYRASGKHFVARNVTARLDGLRDNWQRIEGAEVDRRRLDDFLFVALDKVDGRYDYASYCALPVLGLDRMTAPGLTRREVLCQRDAAQLALLGDLAGFELDALEGTAEILPEKRPAPDLARRRLRLVLAALRPTLERESIVLRNAGPEGDARSVADHARARVSKAWRHRLDASMIPVHVVHDEYLFLRVLQSFEVTFAWIATVLQEAVSALPTAPARAVERLKLANVLLREALRLFPLIGSLQPAAFHDFRRFTEGASAIQSTGYKRVEALCSAPGAERLNSVAYRSVPQVQEEVRAGVPSLSAALETLRDDRASEPDDLALLDAEMTEFARQLGRWRQAHFELARRYLGERGGTGYTEGVPYLAETRQIPVFRSSPPGSS